MQAIVSKAQCIEFSDKSKLSNLIMFDDLDDPALHTSNSDRVNTSNNSSSSQPREILFSIDDD